MSTGQSDGLFITAVMGQFTETSLPPCKQPDDFRFMTFFRIKCRPVGHAATASRTRFFRFTNDARQKVSAVYWFYGAGAGYFYASGKLFHCNTRLRSVTERGDTSISIVRALCRLYTFEPEKFSTESRFRDECENHCRAFAA